MNKKGAQLNLMPKGFKKWRRDTCAKCGKPIFYIEYDNCDRVWWHEDPALDFKHKPEPKGEEKNAKIAGHNKRSR